MEPVTYMVGISWTLAGYSYFLWKKNEFGVGGLRNVLMNDAKQKLLKEDKLNLERLDMVKMRIREITMQIDILESYALN
jgi:hypothetical protein